jgi:hypothetical protein
MRVWYPPNLTSVDWVSKHQFFHVLHKVYLGHAMQSSNSYEVPAKTKMCYRNIIYIILIHKTKINLHQLHDIYPKYEK